VKSASLIITDTEKLKKIIARVHKIPLGKIFAFTNEWDASLFYRWKRCNINEEKWVLFFGTALEHKGLEYLIQAEPMIARRHPDVRIVIAGKGQEKYYHLLKNKDRYVLLNRFIDYKEGAVLFQKSMVIVLPYITGTVSGIIPVAYAFKKPIVATRVGCFEEVIENGKTGILVPPRDPKALAEAIITLLENEDKRRRMGEAGFAKLKTEMSWDVFVDNLIATYKNYQ
jgi:glycosyltransferase involved in cell wall biosynthesis